jgi:pyruvate/2-oxoglutarate dehydrogenase complex dihydrolipoamide dehydrogenase (E3) component
LPFDIVVAGIGVIANDDLAREAGIEVEDGILADAQGRTSDPNVFAAGDCARHVHTGFAEKVRFESVQSAIDQGKVVAAAILGQDDTHSAVPWFWSDQYDAKLQVVGIPEAIAQASSKAIRQRAPLPSITCAAMTRWRWKRSTRRMILSSRARRSVPTDRWIKRRWTLWCRFRHSLGRVVLVRFRAQNRCPLAKTL